MNKPAFQKIVSGALAAAIGIGPVSAVDRLPTPSLPEAYSMAEQMKGPRSAEGDLKGWWRQFNDPKLDSLIDRALAGNLDLKIAQERIREARATRSYTSATRQLPQTGVSGGFTDRSTTGGLFQTGFDTVFELDLFGGARSSVRAAEADAQAIEESLKDLNVTVAAETAVAYLQLRQAQERLALSRQTIKALEDSLHLVDVRRAAGLTSEFDTVRAQAQVETTRAGIPLLEAQEQRSINALAVLLGQEPTNLRTELAGSGTLPVAPPEVPIGLPSDLLRRRPDIRVAEKQVAGAAARVGVAVSNLYPKFSLTTGGGGQSSVLSSILSGATRLFSFGASFSWGLLNYPATKANINVAKSREQQSLITYERTILTALQEVEDALANYVKEKERQASLVKAMEANQDALQLATVRYESGLSSYLDVLDAQRSLYSSQDALVQHRANLPTHLVALYKALGGGW